MFLFITIFIHFINTVVACFKSLGLVEELLCILMEGMNFIGYGTLDGSSLVSHVAYAAARSERHGTIA